MMAPNSSQQVIFLFLKQLYKYKLGLVETENRAQRTANIVFTFTRWPEPVLQITVKFALCLLDVQIGNKSL